MKAYGPVLLRATTSESSYPLPTTCVGIILKNLGDQLIRYSFTTGKVATATSSNPPLYTEFDVLRANQELNIQLTATSATFYYASNVPSAEFTINALIA